MTFPSNPAERSPKGDHNRRLSLGIEIEDLATAAGVTTEELRRYEFTDVDGTFDIAVAERVGLALERFESAGPGKIDNGPSPGGEAIEARIEAALRDEAFVGRLSDSDIDTAEALVVSELNRVDRLAQLASFGERARGPVRELLVGWTIGEGRSGETVIPVKARSA